MPLEEMPEDEDLKKSHELDESEHGDPLEEERHDEDDDEEYGRKVRKRINKEVAKRKALEEENAQLRQELEADRQRKAKEAQEAEDAGLERKHKDLKAQIKAAADEADLEKVVELQEELADVLAEKKVRKLRPTTEQPEKPEKLETAAKADDASAGEMDPAAKAWVERNEWFGAKEHASLKRLAGSIEEDLIAEGFEYSEELYEELDRRLEAAAPRIAKLRTTKAKDEGLEEEEEEEEQPTKREQKPPAVMGGGRHVPNQQGNKPTRRLSGDDLKAMRRYGLDPDKPADRKAWLDRNNL